MDRLAVLGVAVFLLAGCGQKPGASAQEAACELVGRDFADVHDRNDMDAWQVSVTQRTELCMRAHGFELRDNGDDECKMGIAMVIDHDKSFIRDTDPKCYGTASWF